MLLIPSTNRFTVPTGKAGIYSISAHLRLATSASNLNLAVMYLYKNNAIAKYAYNNNASNPLSANSIALTTLLDLNVGDYLEIICVYARSYYCFRTFTKYRATYSFLWT